MATTPLTTRSRRLRRRGQRYRFVAVTNAAPDAEQIRAIHAELRRHHPKPDFDGLYVRRDDLRADPATVPAGVSAHEWRVDPASRFERNLVTWQVLAQGGVGVRGPAVEDLAIHIDWPALAEATRRNLDDYWTPRAARAARTQVGLTAWATSWGVLGVARLRHTLAVGRITSKTEAAAYATATYSPAWHRVVAEALRIRCCGRPVYRNPWRRRTDLVGFLREALSR